MAEKPTFAFMGDVSGTLAQAVAPQVALVPFTDVAALTGIGVLVDGATADPGALVLQQALESGKILAVAEPSPGQRQSLMALTGAGPAEAAPLVTYVRAPSGRGFSCHLVPPPGELAACRADESGGHPFNAEPAHTPNLGEQLSQIAAATAAPAQDTGTFTVPGFVPPEFSMAGYHSVSMPMNWTVPYPQNNGKPDDETVGRADQSITQLLTTEFYVYWVNGAIGSEAPYFVSIVRQVGPMGIGSFGANSEHSRGYFQLYFKIGPNGFADAGNRPLTGGYRLDNYLPTSASDGEFESLPMGLWGSTKSGGGTGTTSFTAQTHVAGALTGWNVADQSSGNQSAWLFHQDSGWDPVSTGWYPVATQKHRPPSVLYDDQGHVIRFPGASFSSIFFETVTAWTFVPPLDTLQPFRPPFCLPASYQVTFSGGWSQAVAFAHDPNGCSGAFSGNNSRHVFGYEYTLPGPSCTWSLNLSHIAALRNYPQQQG